MDDSDTSSGALEDGCTLQSNPESLMLMRPKLLELHRQLVMLIYPFIGGEDIEKAAKQVRLGERMLCSTQNILCSYSGRSHTQRGTLLLCIRMI
jgi:hypothetical protein